MRRPEQRNITYSSVRAPKWNSPNRSSINCLVKFDHSPDEHPFTAAPYDSEPHGREIFQRLVAGEFGEIAPFEPRPIDAEAHRQAAAAFNSFATTPSGAESLAEIDDYNEEIASRSSRGLATHAETYLSKGLAIFLQRAGVPDSKIKRVSFAKKIEEAEILGAISRTERIALDLIRKIRNEIAHENGNFYTVEILNLTKQLHSSLGVYMRYKQVSSLSDKWIDWIFIDAFNIINMSLKARADPNIKARIVS